MKQILNYKYLVTVIGLFYVIYKGPFIMRWGN